MRSEMTTRQDPDRPYVEQVEVFELLYQRVENLLERFGRPSFLPGQRHGDYTVQGDYGGYQQVVVFVNKLQMLQSGVVCAVQELVREFPGWEVEFAVAVWGHFKDWPNMGLYIRPHEIIDGLQRQYFPKEFQDLDYSGAEGARPGTAYD
jgi:hypothetical protein